MFPWRIITVFVVLIVHLIHHSTGESVANSENTQKTELDFNEVGSETTSVRLSTADIETFTVEPLTRHKTSTERTVERFTTDTTSKQTNHVLRQPTPVSKAIVFQPTLYRHGRKFEPERRENTVVETQQKKTDFLIPHRLGLYTTTSVIGEQPSTTQTTQSTEVEEIMETSSTSTEAETTTITYNPSTSVSLISPIAEEFIPMELLTYRATQAEPIVDIRPTKTVGLAQADTEQLDEPFFEETVDSSPKEQIVTLVGFVDFTTSVSGTQFVFQPSTKATPTTKQVTTSSTSRFQIRSKKKSSNKPTENKLKIEPSSTTKSIVSSESTRMILSNSQEKTPSTEPTDSTFSLITEGFILPSEIISVLKASSATANLEPSNEMNPSTSEVNDTKNQSTDSVKPDMVQPNSTAVSDAEFTLSLDAVKESQDNLETNDTNVVFQNKSETNEKTKNSITPSTIGAIDIIIPNTIFNKTLNFDTPTSEPVAHIETSTTMVNKTNDEVTKTLKATTFFTTYTYFTTLYDDNSEVADVTSREEVVTNVVKASETSENVTPETRLESSEETIKHTPAETPSSGSTLYTTYTYYTTFYNGDTSSVESNLETVSHVLTDGTLSALPKSEDVLESTMIDIELLNTTPTLEATPEVKTLTYYTTFIKRKSTSVKTQLETITPIAKVSGNDEPLTTVFHSTVEAKPTKTFKARTRSKSSLQTRSKAFTKPTKQFTISTSTTEKVPPKPTPTLYTLYTTILTPVTVYRDGQPVVSFLSKTSTILTTLLPNSTAAGKYQQTIPASTSALFPIEPTRTELTTFTIFTTLELNGTPTVTSREEVITKFLTLDTSYNTPSELITYDNIETANEKVTQTESVEEAIRRKREVQRDIGVTTPITYYTTYTYFTTYLQPDGHSTVASRLDVHSSVVYPDDPIKPTLTRHHDDHHVVHQTVPHCHNCALDHHQHQHLRTVYTTYTDFITEFVHGHPVTSTRYHTVTNYVPDATEHTFLARNRDHDHHHHAHPGTEYTTYTYFTTRFYHGQPVVSTRYETITNVQPFRHTHVPAQTIYKPVFINPTAVRDTIYTTFTYFTTRLIHGHPSVTTRYETVTDYVTVTVAPNHHHHHDHLVTTYTYFQTQYIQGRPIISTRYDTVTDYRTVTVTERLRPTVVHDYHPQVTHAHDHYPHHVHDHRGHGHDTAYTTYTYYTTHYAHGHPQVETRYETKAIVASVTLSEHDNDHHIHQRIQPTHQHGPYRTYHTTFTYFTTKFEDGTAIVNTRKHTITNTVLGAYCRTCDHHHDHQHDHGHIVPHTHVHDDRVHVHATPTTYYTTYTYRTTLLDAHGHPDVTTRYETVTDVVDGGVVLPTRTRNRRAMMQTDLQPSDFRRRLLTIDEASSSTDTMDESEDSNTASLLPTGLLSSFVNSVSQEKKHTYITTNYYGTYIRGSYAQIPLTTSSVDSADEVKTSSTTANDQPIGLLTVSSSTAVRDGITTVFNTEISGTFINGFYAHVASTSTKVINPTTTDAISTPISSKTAVVVVDGKSTLYITNVYSTMVGGIYAELARTTTTILDETAELITTTSPKPLTSIDLTSSTVKVLSTPVLPEAQILSTPVLPETQKPTGLLSSTIIDSTVLDGTTILQISGLFGTYIGTHYAQFGKLTISTKYPTSTPISSFSAALTSSVTNTQEMKTGLVSSTISTEVISSITTLHTIEIYGTSIGGYYAHIAKQTSTVLNASPTTSIIGTSISTEINAPYTTVHTTLTYATSINGLFAHVARSTSNVFGPTTTTSSTNSLSTGLISRSVSSEISDDQTTYVTRDISGTFINGFYAHIARTHSNIVTNTAAQSISLNSTTSTQTTTENKETITNTISDNQISSSTTTSSITLEVNTKLFSETQPVQNASKNEQNKDEITYQTTLSTSALVENVNQQHLNLQLDTQTSNVTVKETSSAIQPSFEVTADYSPAPNTTPLLSESTSSENILDVPSSDTTIFQRKSLMDSITEIDDNPDVGNTNEIIEASQDNLSIISRTTRIRPVFPSRRLRKKQKTQIPIYEEEYNDSEDSEIDEEEEILDEYLNEDDYHPSSFQRKRRPTRAGYTNNGRRDHNIPDERDDAEDNSAVKKENTQVNIRPYRTRGAGLNIPTRSTASKYTVTMRKSRKGNHRNSDIVDEENFEENISQTISRRQGQPASSRRKQPRGRNGRLLPSTSDDNYEDEYDEETAQETEERQERNSKTRSRNIQRNRRKHRINSPDEEEADETEQTETHTRNRTPKPVHDKARLPSRPPLLSPRNRANRLLSLRPSFSTDGETATARGRRRSSAFNPRKRSSSSSTPKLTTKPTVTLTSVITTIKTLPIYHGFRTSFATLTTTALATSLIAPTRYSTNVDSDGHTKTLISSRRDDSNPPLTTVTEVLVVTSELEQVRVVSIRIGFGTRTDTITETTTLTQLTTSVSTITPEHLQNIPMQQTTIQIPGAPLGQAFGHFFQAPTYQIYTQDEVVTYTKTETITSTAVVAVNFRGKTVMSTITKTSLQEITLTSTTHIPIRPTANAFVAQPYFQLPPAQITTMLTLYLTGDQGEVKPVVTTVTVPFYGQQQQPIAYPFPNYQHIKVARSVPVQLSAITLLKNERDEIYSAEAIEVSGSRPKRHHWNT